MKPKFRTFSRRSVLIASSLSLTFSFSASAAPYTWDADGVDPLNNGGGSWNATGGTNWFDGVSYGPWGNTNADEAIFGVNAVGSGAAGIITVGTVTANKITFNAPESGNYTLSGGTITLDGAIPTITASADATISSVLAGSVALTKTGAGTLFLSGTNTYNGGTNVTGGTLSVGTSANLGTGNGVSLNGGALAITSNNQTFAQNFTIGAGGGTITMPSANQTTNLNGTFSGAGQLTFNGTGDTALNGVNSSLSGGIIINAGRVRIDANAAAIGSGTVTVNGSGQLYAGAATMANDFIISGFGGNANDGDQRGALRFDGGTVNGNIALAANAGIGTAFGLGTVNGVISGNSNLTIVNGGNQTSNIRLNGTNTYSGSTTVGSGGGGASFLTIGNAGTLASGNYAGNIIFNASNSTLNYSSSVDQTFSGVMSGAGKLIKDTSNSNLTLSGPNTFTGGVTVSTGKVTVTSINGLGAGAVTNNGIIDLSATPGNYTGLSTSLSGAGTVNVNTLGTGTTTTLLNGNFSAFTGIWNIGVGAAASGGKIQMNGADNAAATINMLSNSTMFLSAAGVTHNASIVLNGGDTGESIGQLRIENSTWAGSVTLAGAITGANDGFIGSNGAIGTISGNIGEINGSQILSKAGAGTTILTGQSTYTGGTAILGGTLSVSGSGSLRAGNYTDVITGGGALTFDTSVVHTLSGANTHTGALKVNSGKVILSNQGASNSGSYVVASGATLEMNVATGARTMGTNSTFTGAGNFIKSGNGTLVWGARAATYNFGSGALIDVQGGQLTGGSNANEVWTNNLSNLNVASGATFAGVEANVRVNAITGDGTISSGFNGAGYQKFTFGVDNGSGTFNGALTNGTSTGSFVKEGTGTQTLTNVSTYTGTTTVSAGTLLVNGQLGNTAVSVSSGATLGGLGIVLGTLAFDGNAFFDIGNINQALSVNGGTSFSSAGFGIDNLVQNGSGINWGTITDGTYTLVTGAVNVSNLDNVGSGNAFNIGGGRQAYFQSGSLELVVIPEPTSALLCTLGALTLLVRRRVS